MATNCVESLQKCCNFVLLKLCFVFPLFKTEISFKFSKRKFASTFSTPTLIFCLQPLSVSFAKVLRNSFEFLIISPSSLVSMVFARNLVENLCQKTVEMMLDWLR